MAGSISVSPNTLTIPARPIPSIPIRFFNISWALVCTTVLAIATWKHIFLTWSYRKRKTPTIRFVSCLILVYGYAVVFAQIVIRVSLRPNLSLSQCDSLNLATMGLYLSFEFSVYYYFVEKIYQTQANAGRRLRSWLYLFNFIIVLGTYLGLIVVQFFSRQSIIGQNECRLKRKKLPVVLLLIFSMVALVYLTGAFLIPIWRVQKSNDLRQHDIGRRLNQLALKAFYGGAVILVAVSVNRIIHVIFNGFPIWLTIDTDMTVITIVGLTLTLMNIEDTCRSSAATLNIERPSMISARGRVNNLDWMNPTSEELADEDGPRRNLSQGSTIVTIAASRKRPNEPPNKPPKDAILVQTERTTHYESVGQPIVSKGSPNKVVKRATLPFKRSSATGESSATTRIIQSAPGELSFITSALDEVGEEDDFAVEMKDKNMPGVIMTPSHSEEPKIERNDENK